MKYLQILSLRTNIKMRLFILFILFFSLSAMSSEHAQFSPQPKYGWTEQELNGIQFSYYIPKSEGVINNKRALMVVLHGCYQTSTDATKYADFESDAERLGMIVLGINVRDGGNAAACWEYYGDKSFDEAAIRQNPLRPKGRDEAPQKDVLEVVSHLLAQPELELDPKQVYLTGISSGAGVVMNLACEAPDVFAGIGMFDGPTIGASAAMKSFNASSSYADGLKLCKEVSGNYKSHFSTQIAAIAYGDKSLSLPTEYSHFNVKIFAKLYGADHEDSCTEIRGGASEIAWKNGDDKRAVLVVVHGMLHRWPVGPDMNKNAIYASSDYISWPKYFTKFVFENSMRVPRLEPTDDGIYGTGSCKRFSQVEYSTPAQVYMDYILNGWKYDKIVKELRATRAAAPRCEPFEKQDIIPQCKQSGTPLITLTGDNPLKIRVGASFSDPGASAMDIEDRDITDEMQSVSDVNADVPGEYKHVYHVEDSHAATTQQTRTVIVH